MSITQLRIVVALLLGGTALVMISARRSQMALREQNERLRQELAQLGSENESLSNRLARIKAASAERLAEPPTPRASASASVEAALATNLIALLVHGGEAPLLTRAQLKRYLEENRRSATSLLAAYRTSRDPAFLREAMEKYPANPKVAFEAVLDKNASPAQRQQWLEAFKKAAPENPVANYLSALESFKANQPDQAVQELVAASGQQGFVDYTVERIQADVEAYRAADYSEADAKMAATWGVALPHLAEMKTLAQDVVALATSYRQAGDENSAHAMLQMVVGLGQQMDAPSGSCVPLVTRMVGIAIERMAFNSMRPSSSYGDGTIQDQLTQLAQRRDSIKDLVQQSSPLQEQMTAEDWLAYNDRTLNFGEEDAIGWLLNKYGQK